ncbi:MAG: hypothetical protein NVS9B1_12310 [Candidatus Dormibacteraceae bacterium]
MSRLRPTWFRLVLVIADLVLVAALASGLVVHLPSSHRAPQPLLHHRVVPSLPAPVAAAQVPTQQPAALPAPTEPPGAAAAVAADVPVRLLIPAISVSTRVEMVGVGVDGAMQTPNNIYNVGWYSPGVRPGQAGDAVIDGHVGLPGQPLVFANLGRLRLGDAITVVRGDGRSSHFIVARSRVVPAGSRPAGLFAADGAATLSLITCTGQYDGGNYSYADRLIVDARYAGTD